MSIWGGIEAGGTKVVCAVGTGPDDLGKRVRFTTGAPGETLPRIIDFFCDQQRRKGPLKAIGIGSFGPLDADRMSPTFGYITNTPKAGWSNTDFAGPLKKELGIPVGFDTDVNVAALGENRWGAARGLDSFVYLTVGTGIGGGGMINGRLIHGLCHPEMGHIRIPHDFESDPYKGACPFHGDCLEGLASGVALEKRWGRQSEKLRPNHSAWSLEAHYLALGLVNLILALSPERIIMGGGVMQQRHLFPLIRREVQTTLNDYLKIPALRDDIETYIVPPVLGDKAGVLGAIALAQQISA
jgi:fructokinase